MNNRLIELGWAQQRGLSECTATCAWSNLRHCHLVRYAVHVLDSCSYIIHIRQCRSRSGLLAVVMAITVRQHVEAVVGNGGDVTVREYFVQCLEDEEFHLGEQGEEAFDAFAPVLVDGGVCPDEDAAAEVCRKLAQLLGRDKPTQSIETAFRALGGGPKSMHQLTDDVSIHFSERPNVRDMIQTPLGDDASHATERDLLKARKREEKEEKQRKAALAAHMARIASIAHAPCPKIMRNAGAGGSKDLHVETFSLTNGGAELISDASLMLAFGRRYGLIGRNGAGKSTLLRAMASHTLPGIPTNWQVLHVEQEVIADETPVLQAVLMCDGERTELLAEEQRLLAQLNREDGQGATHSSTDAKPLSDTDASARLEEVVKRLHEIDAYGAEARAATILSGLSFSTAMQRRATREFSGGWRMRVSLARALFVQPDLLLLDEPTNHLDLEACVWLEEYLLHWPKTVLVVSHAREFLNAVCTDIIHLHDRKLTPYKGNFAQFEKTLEERMENQQKAAASVAAKKAHMQAFVDKFRYNAKRASLVQSRLKAIEKLQDVEVMQADPDYQFLFPNPDENIGTPILGFSDVSFNYPNGPTLFFNLNFGLDLNSRAAVVGPNGIGKTTLLHLLSGQLQPSMGVIARNPRLRLAIFSQHHVDNLDLSLTPHRYMCKCYPGVKEQLLRSHLGAFGVSGDMALQPMYTLSGGQKSRVAFAKITWPKPHFLLLDEPSNHLDIQAVDALIHGLTVYQGGVLMVSHDQYLIESCVEELWVVEGGTITTFHGTFEDYKKRLKARMA